MQSNIQSNLKYLHKRLKLCEVIMKYFILIQYESINYTRLNDHFYIHFFVLHHVHKV